MKRIFIVFLLMSVWMTPFAQNYSPNYLDGHLYLKFKDSFPINYVVNEDKTVDIQYFKEYQALFNEYGVTQITRPLDAFQDPRLLRTIELTFSEINRIEDFIKELSAFPNIEYAEKIPLMFPNWVPNDPYYGTVGGYNYKWHLDMVNAAAAWDLQRGSAAVKVAIVDNAIWGAHPDLQISAANLCTFTSDNNYTTGSASPPSDVAQNANCTQEDLFTYGTCDAYSWSHGTHCAGLAGAINNNNTGVASLGGGVTLMGIRTSEEMEYLSFTDAGVNWAANNGAHVISMSYGGSQYSTTTANLFNTLYNNNIICVAAAGNEGEDENYLSYPACYDGVISVASINNDGKLSSFSQYGPGRADIAAPGGYSVVNNQITLPNMLSTTYCTSQLIRIYGISTFDGMNYDGMQGTSMACPMVAGLCGLLVSAYPDITPAQVLECLQSTATPLTSGSNQIDGNGYINAEAAVACAQSYASAIQVNPQQLTFATTVGTTSTSQSVTVTTSGLSNNITITTAAPFQVSSNNNTWGTSINMVPNGGTLYVRYQPTVAGTITGSVTLNSVGETPVTVALFGTATAQGDCDAPVNFTVEATDAVTADLSWTAPMSASIIEDVESHTAFTINSPGSIDWSYIDGDGANTYTYSTIDYTNEGNPMAFIVMDVTQTSGSFSLTAHSGNKFFGVPIADGTTNNDWIISPELNFADDFTFSFYARSAHSSYATEQFYVAYSTSGTAQGNFTNLNSITTTTTTWTQYSYTVPATAKYVAIRCVSNDQYFFCVDDIAIEGNANITYRVYRDGQLITTTNQTSYSDGNLQGGNYTYCVEAVYENNCVSAQVCETVFIEGDDPFLTVDDHQADLNAESGSSDTIHVTTNTDWTLTSNCGSDFTIIPTSGHGSADIIIIANSDNPSLEDSIACTITIQGVGVNSETIGVVQHAIIPLFTATPNNVLLTQQAFAANTFDIHSNLDWNLQCNESWLILSNDSGTGNATVTVTALTANLATTERTATIHAVTDYVTTNITIRQAGLDLFLNITTDEITMGAPAGRTASFAVLSNVDWTISNNAAWLDVTPMAGSDNMTIQLTTNSENNIGTSRFAMLSITDGTRTKMVEVEQLFSVGIDEETAEPTFSVYPNPANQTIFVNSSQTDAHFSIVDLLGKVLKTGALEKERNAVSIANLPSGIYFIRIDCRNKQNTYKFIKK